MDCSLPGSSVHGIFQARVLEWVAISFSRGSSQPRDQTQVSCIAGRHFTIWATREVLVWDNFLRRSLISLTKKGKRPFCSLGFIHLLYFPECTLNSLDQRAIWISQNFRWVRVESWDNGLKLFLKIEWLLNIFYIHNSVFKTRFFASTLEGI